MRTTYLSYRRQALVPLRSHSRLHVLCLTAMIALFLVAAPTAPVLAQTPPANDDFANATVLGTDAGSLAGETNVDASVEAGEPPHATYGPFRSVWYSFTPSVSGNAVVEVDAQDVSDDLVLGVYAGSAVDALTELGSAGPGSYRLRVEARVVAGVTYHIVVAGQYNTDAGLFGLWWSVPSPGNDDFANATVLTPDAGSLVGESNEWATVEVGEPPHATHGPFRSVWYSFTPSVTGNVVVEADAQDTDDLVLGVYSGSSVDALTELGSAGPGWGLLRVEFRVVAGVTYHIAVAGQNDNDTGLFDLDWSMPSPGNDDFANATVLTPDAGSLVGESNEWASVEVGEPLHATYGPARSVWYSFTPSVSGNAVVEADAQGTDDLVLGVYSGSSVDALTDLGSAGPSYGLLRVEFRVVAGVTYHIAVAGKNDNDTGLFDLDWSVPSPGNDDFALATVLTPDAGSLVGESNDWATVEKGEPAHATYGPFRSVWYSFTPSVTGNAVVVADAQGTEDLVLGVYSGSSVDGLTELGSAGPSYGSLTVEYRVVAGITYHIAVAGQTASDTDLFDLDWSVPSPGNDDFALATVLTPDAGSLVGESNEWATVEMGEPAHATYGPFRSVWYSFTPSVTGNAVVVADAQGTEDLVLGVYSGSSVDGLTELGSAGPSYGSLTVEYRVVAGITYHIAVAGKNDNDTGLFDLDWSVPSPGNDDYALATVLTPDAGSLVGESNEWATVEVGEPAHATYGPFRSVWYSFTPSVTGNAVVEADAQDIDDLVLGVYSGSSVDDLVDLGSAGPGWGPLKVEFRVVAGVTYHIAVAGKNDNDTGLFDLDWRMGPDSDDFVGAKPLVGDAGSLVGETNVDASFEPGEPPHATYGPFRSVWYSFTPSVTGNAVVEADAQDIDDLVLGVYSGSSVDDLVDLGSAGPGWGPLKVEFRVVAGVTYHIAVAGKNDNDTGLFDLDWRMGPDNDDFVGAKPLVGDAGSLVGETNVDASFEPGEPPHATYGPARSVWYSFTPSHSGVGGIVVDVSDVEDMVLGVYSGSSVDALTELASDGPKFVNLRVEFEIIAGTTYYIAVAGQTDYDTGMFDISWGTVDVLVLHPTEELVPTDGAAGDHAGYSVALSGDTALVGAPDSDFSSADAGAVHPFSGAGWSEGAALEAAAPAADDDFGEAVAISGHTAIVGARYSDIYGTNSGAASIFSRSGDTWAEYVALTSVELDGSDYFGGAVAISGDTAVVGATRGGFGGKAFVYVESGGTWIGPTKFSANDGFNDPEFDTGDYFGVAVAIDGDTLVVGASGDEVGLIDNGYITWYLQAGAVYVYVRDGGTWSRQQRLTASDFGSHDRFGRSVAVSGNTIIVGSNNGAAYIFTRTGTTWSQERRLTPALFSTGFGKIVALEGDTALVGYGAGSFVETHARNGTWDLQAVLARPGKYYLYAYGDSLAIDGRVALVGSPGAYAEAGAAYLFDLVTEGPNRAPVLDAIGDQSVVKDATLDVAITATDRDGDSLSFGITGEPSFATLVDHGDGSATLSLTPGSDDAGTYPGVTVTVSDSVDTDSETFTITVEETMHLFLPLVLRSH